jgi:hypothetical protein
MGTIKHPGGSDAVTPQQEGGAHPRGTDAKNYDQARKTERERDVPAPDPEADRADSGPDARDALAGRRRDLDENPGIGSSPGTSDSGERGIEERDRGPGIERNG